ncbi:hypothetical protein J5893_00645 [bacterium]|nr:hypothetical protein [bacterium]
MFDKQASYRVIGRFLFHLEFYPLGFISLEEIQLFTSYSPFLMSNHEHNDHLHSIRHSLSHIMAQAVQRVQQADVEIAI